MNITNEQGERLLTVNEVADELGLGAHRVREFVRAGRLVGVVKLGRDWMIPESSLDAVRERKTGRPRKEGDSEAKAG